MNLGKWYTQKKGPFSKEREREKEQERKCREINSPGYLVLVKRVSISIARLNHDGETKLEPENVQSF